MASKSPGALEVAPGLALPADAVTQSFALLAVRRAGKSNAAAVIAEAMHAAGLPWVAIDPKGDWWGLRSSHDGTGPGLPVPVFGGLHGDVPLTPEAGRLIAEIIAEENLTCILDVSDFPSKAAQMRFLTDFAEHLFRLHRKHPQPRHVFLEEADEYLPQRVMGEQAKCVGAWSRLVKQGGAFGLGVTLISQRSAVVNKDALTQVETLIALRTTSPQDRAAIKAWVDYHDAGRELVDSLPGLEDGEAWVVSPHWLARHGQPAIQRVRFRQRATFDSGATPTMASASQRPANLADIDLGAILARMETAAESVADDGTTALRRRVTRLERELAEARSRPPERVEVPVVAVLLLWPAQMAPYSQATEGEAVTVGKHATEEKRRIAEAGTILRCQVGSGVHGTSISGTDDRDEMGVCLEPPDYVIGLRTFEQYEWHSAWERPGGLRNRSGHGDLDITVYSARKWMRLALNGNPSVLLPLFVPEAEVVAMTPLGEELRALAPSIVSRQAGHRFAGYLEAQRRGLLSHEGKGRDVTRPELVEQFGWDTKYGGHMVRLGFQGVELLTTGRITLPMPPRERTLVRSIRKGQVEMEDALDFAAELEAQLRELTESSPLRAEPDRDAADAWLVSAYQRAWKERGI